MLLSNYERIETDWLSVVSRIEHHDVVPTPGRHPGQYVVDKIAFRLDDHDASPCSKVLADQVEQQRRFAHSRGAKDLQVLQSIAWAQRKVALLSGKGGLSHYSTPRRHGAGWWQRPAASPLNR